MSEANKLSSTDCTDDALSTHPVMHTIPMDQHMAAAPCNGIINTGSQLSRPALPRRGTSPNGVVAQAAVDLFGPLVHRTAFHMHRSGPSIPTRRNLLASLNLNHDPLSQASPTTTSAQRLLKQ